MKHSLNAVPHDGGRGVSRLDIIRGILDRSENAMPNQRFQDPKILKRTDVKRPFYYIQPYVPVFTADGLKRLRQNIQLGFCDELTIRNANSVKQQIMAPINAGRFIIQSQVAFKEVVERFIEVHVPTLKGHATQSDYLSKLRRHVQPRFDSMRMCDITTPVIQKWLNDKAAEGQGWWARNGLRNLLSGIFSKAAEWKLWDGANPCAGVKIGPKTLRREKRIPKAEELDRFLDAISDTSIISAAGARLMVITAAVSGLRASEVCGLRVGDIDAVAQTLRVEQTWRRGEQLDPKSAASRRVRQIGAFAEELLAHAAGKASYEPIFTREDGRPLDDRDLQQHVFRPAAEKVGLYRPGFGLHLLRTLNISWRQQAGASPFEAQKAAGHASLSMTWSYTQTEDDREREQVDKILTRLGRKKLQEMTSEGGIQ